ncbi:MAG: phosphoribosylpyrophosphate synthetase [Chitinophagaceae bacterium]|nr:MAG: phosphoribosylpyrophosphate synthetase [Chitinophagaceae bacterium]
MKNYQTLADAVVDLEKRGYQENFEEEEFCLYCRDLRLRLPAEEFSVDEVYRFENDASTGDNAVLYAISSSFGIKGIKVDAVEP